MTLWILKNDYQSIAAQNLIDVVGGASLLQVAGNGRVTLTGSIGGIGDILARLANSPHPVVIRAEGADFSVVPLPGNRMRDLGGEAVYDRYPGTTGVEVVYDATSCAGAGHWVRDAKGEKRALPLYVVLFHELAHADELLRGAVPMPDVESGAIAAENRLRRRDGLIERAGHQGGCGLAPAPKMPGEVAPPPPKPGSCFVASAAYGSPLDPAVASLRAFRDQVLRPTRTGSEFFDDFYRRYDALSRPVVEAMTTDERTRDLVRWALVTPIVHYLEIARELPDADADDVPEPWRTFLRSLLAKLHDFTAAVPWPRTFTGLAPADAVAELAVLCRYVYRSPVTRSAWLTELTRSGALPLTIPPGQRDEHARVLAQAGRPEPEIEAILGPAEGSQQFPRVTYFGTDHVVARNEAATGTWFYTVNVRNLTTDTFDSIDLFYKRRGLNGVVFLTEPNVTPGRIAQFVLGPCDRMESYAVGFILGGDLVAKLPEQGNMTPELASVLSPGDTEPCADSWSIGAG